VATQQQKFASDQVVQAMREIDSVTKQFVSSTRQAASSAAQLNILSEELKNVIGDVKSQAGSGEKPKSRDMSEIRDLIAIFRAETEEHLTRLDNGLVELEKRPGNIELARDLNREVHTLRGGPGFRIH